MSYTRALVASALLGGTLACADASRISAPNAGVADRPHFISNGQPTGSAYGGVGVVLIDEGDPNFVGVCSGSLIAPTVFLTAGHCIGESGTDYYVSFTTALSSTSVFIKSSTAFRAKNADVGVVILPAGSTSGVPVYDLPSLGTLDALKKGGALARETATVVGYGIASLHRGPATSELDGVRRFAETRVLSIQGPYLFIADAHGQSTQGGTCNGDSGGPVFLESDPTVIVAITSFGFPEGCHAIGAYTRVDTEAALTFLSQFVAL